MEKTKAITATSKTAKLSQSVRVFSDPHKWRAYKAVEISTEETLSDVGTMFGALVNGIWGDDDDKVKAAKDMDSVKGYGQKIKPGSDALRALEKGLILRLVSGELIAEGYFTPRHPSSQKTIIPSDVWTRHPSIKWHLETVKGQGMEFTQVEVYLPVQTINEIRPQKEIVKKQGRPSVKPFIEDAYISLRERGLINYEGPKSALNGPICDWLVDKYPDRSNDFKKLDYSTIRKTITKLFDVDASK